MKSSKQHDKDEFEMKLIGKQSSPDISISSSHASSKDSSQKSYFMFFFMIFLSVALKTLQPISIANSKNEDGTYRYSESTMVLLVEMVKFIFCASVFLLQYYETEPNDRSSLHNMSLVESVHFFIPAFCYACSNILQYFGMAYINPSLFHVFGNVRILIVGVLYRLIMKKKITEIKWVSFLLIAIGSLIAAPKPEKTDTNENPLLGFLLLSLMYLFSTIANIYLEKYYRATQKNSIFYQNSILYLYGILINTVLVVALTSTVENKKVFDGFDSAGLFVLLVQSAMGISLSFIFKFLDNIVYNISLTLAMIVTSVASIIFFNFVLTLNFVGSILVILAGIYLYYRDRLLTDSSAPDKNSGF